MLFTYRYSRNARIECRVKDKGKSMKTTKDLSVLRCVLRADLVDFIYLGFYAAVQVISQRVDGRAEETSTYSLPGFCTVNCRTMASNYQLSHLTGTEPRPQRWEARVLPLCHRGPSDLVEGLYAVLILLQSVEARKVEGASKSVILYED